MKKLLSFTISFIVSLISFAQFGIPSSVPRVTGNVPVPVYYTVYLKDGRSFTGVGEFDSKKGAPLLKVDYFGQKRRVTPAETLRITTGRDLNLVEMVNYKDKDWLKKLNGDSKGNGEFFGSSGNELIVLIKEGDDFRELLKEEVLSIVSGNKKAEKLAKNGNLRAAIRSYLQPDEIYFSNISTVPAKFNVTYKNGGTESGKGLIENNEGVFLLTIKNSENKMISVKPSETETITKFVGNKTYEGLPFENRYWIFKSFEGKIAGYSLHSELQTLYAVMDGDEIKIATKELILKMVEGNNRAENAASKGDLTNAIKIFNYVHPADARKSTDENKN